MKILNYFSKKRKFNKISKDIKDIKIQGASNVARNALEAYYLFPSNKSKRKLLKLRPTEPMLENVLDLVDKIDKKEILKHFSETQEKINKSVFSLIRPKEIIFTHCHSTNVVKALIYSKKKGKNFKVYNTETRPLFQGRKTAIELKNNRIPLTMFVDSAVGVALSKERGKKKVSKIFLGADAITNEGVINKIGSETIAIIAKQQKISVYVIADSWKFTKNKVPLENRELNEVWDNAPKHIKIQNPAFEFVPREYIKGIVSEFGVLSYSEFLKRVK